MPSRSDDKRRKKTATRAKRVRKEVAKKAKPVARKAKKTKAKKKAVRKTKKVVVRKAKVFKEANSPKIVQHQQTRWLSVAVAEGSEIQVAKFINRVKGVVQVLLPTHDGSALYPGYVFSECDFSDDALTDICHLADVEGILSKKDGICNYALGGHEAPAELEPEALRSVRESGTRYAKIVRNEMTTVKKGQNITITAGVFSGMSGHVVSVNRRKMSIIAKVRLSDGGMVRKVSIKYGQFEVMEVSSDDWRL